MHLTVYLMLSTCFQYDSCELFIVFVAPFGGARAAGGAGASGGGSWRAKIFYSNPKSRVVILLKSLLWQTSEAVQALATQYFGARIS